MRCQDTVDNAPYFPEVLKKFEVWLKGHDLLTEEGSLAEGVVWVTDGVSCFFSILTVQRKYNVLMSDPIDASSNSQQI